ncbi:Acyltransferase [Aphelenchoides besseyi]|nr:Acyltransferase [Aphelenchoides besseyi]
MRLAVKYRAVHFVDRIVHLVVAIAIITLVTVRVFSTKSTSRLVLLSLAVLVIARSGESLILSNRLLVTLGDISYSVYMVHWPIFEFHRYVDVTTYSYRRRVSFPTYNRISGYIRGWKSLISVILVLYLLIFASMDYLQKNRTNEEKILSMVPNVLKDMRHINNDMMEIWRTRNQLKPLNASFSMAYNIQFKKLSWELRTCPNTAKSAIPTTYNIVPMDIKGTCYQQGKGAKNIVLIGNSHAKAIYFGVIGQSQKKRYLSPLFVDDMVKMLKAFKHPIDIIIVGNAYLLPYDPPINMRNLSLDPLYMEIQKRYTELAEIARDVVFVPRGHFDTGISNHLQTLQKRILYNQDLSMFRTPVWFNRQGFLVNLKKRVDLLNCSKCVVINWEDLWCNKTEGRCDTIDQFRRLSYFYDTNHHNAYGALHVGNFIRDLYNQWMEKQSKKVESPQNNSSTKQSINVKALNKPLDLLNDKLLNGTSQFNNLTDSIASNVKNNSSLQTVKNMTKTS